MDNDKVKAVCAGYAELIRGEAQIIAAARRRGVSERDIAWAMKEDD